MGWGPTALKRTPAAVVTGAIDLFKSWKAATPQPVSLRRACKGEDADWLSLSVEWQRRLMQGRGAETQHHLPNPGGAIALRATNFCAAGLIACSGRKFGRGRDLDYLPPHAPWPESARSSSRKVSGQILFEAIRPVCPCLKQPGGGAPHRQDQRPQRTSWAGTSAISQTYAGLDCPPSSHHGQVHGDSFPRWSASFGQVGGPPGTHPAPQNARPARARGLN